MQAAVQGARTIGAVSRRSRRLGPSGDDPTPSLVTQVAAAEVERVRAIGRALSTATRTQRHG